MAECRTSVLEDPRRLDAVRRASLLDTPAEPGFDRLTKLASRLLKAPIALFSLLDAGRQYFKSTLGVPAPWGPGVNVPIDHSICKYTLEGQPLIVKDLREDPAFAQGLFKGNGLIRKLGLGAYLGVPVTTEDGLCIGTLCVVDHRARD
jgi:GAF domain-containing protein